MFSSSCSLRWWDDELRRFASRECRWDSSLAPGFPVPEWHWYTPESERVPDELRRAALRERRWDSSLAPGFHVPEWHWCTPESERVPGEWCLESDPLTFDIGIVPFKNIPQENNVPIPDNLVPPHIADIPLPLLLLPLLPLSRPARQRIFEFGVPVGALSRRHLPPYR